jgi:hypothetical protein
VCVCVCVCVCVRAVELFIRTGSIRETQRVFRSERSQQEVREEMEQRAKVTIVLSRTVQLPELDNSTT